METKNQLGEYLRMLRKKANYSQEYVAQELNIIRQSYSHYEVGRSIPSIRTLYRLSQLYNVPVESFVDKLGYMKKHIDYSDKEEKITYQEETLLAYFNELDEEEQDFLIAFLGNYKKNKRGI